MKARSVRWIVLWALMLVFLLLAVIPTMAAQADYELNFALSGGTVDENGGSYAFDVVLTVTANTASPIEAELSYFSNGSTELLNPPGMVTFTNSGGFTPGTYVQTVTVNVIDNVNADGLRGVTISIVDENVGAENTHILTINDDESPSVGVVVFSELTDSVSEGAGLYNIEVVLTVSAGTAPLTSPVTVEFVIEGDAAADLSAGTSTITFTNGGGFTAGSYPTELTLGVTDNAQVEADRTGTISLGTPSTGTHIGAISQHMVTILDDDSGSSVLVPTDLATDQMTYTTVPAEPIFSWTGTQNATQYRLYVWDGTAAVIDMTFATDICSGLECEVDSGDFLPDWGMLENEYDWWVGAIYANGQQGWSGGGSYLAAEFSVSLPAAVLPVPIVSPNTGQPTISWPDDPNTLWVQIWVGPGPWGNYLQWVERNGDPHDSIPDFTCDMSVCSVDLAWNAPGRNASGTLIEYTAWIQAWSPGGFSSGGPVAAAPAWNDSDPFTLPTEQPDASTFNPGVYNASVADPIIVWDSSPSASWYQVYVTTAPTEWGYVFGSNASWYTAFELGCANGLPTSCLLEIPDFGDLLTSGTEYAIYIQAWGPAGFSINGPYDAPLNSWAEGAFTYTPEA